MPTTPNSFLPILGDKGSRLHHWLPARTMLLLACIVYLLPPAFPGGLVHLAFTHRASLSEGFHCPSVEPLRRGARCWDLWCWSTLSRRRH
jgi:hypothetical protein